MQQAGRPDKPEGRLGRRRRRGDADRRWPADISSACAPRQHDRDERCTGVENRDNEMSEDVQEDTAAGPTDWTNHKP